MQYPLLFSFNANSQVIISQYYEGNNTNKWIELTNMGTTSVNTASPQLKLGIWPTTGTKGNIKFSGSPTYTVSLNDVIPAKGTVLIGNTNNATEVPYLTAASALQTSNTVINFDGNDGIALLNSSNIIIDKFGQGINAANISYVRNSTVTSPTATFSVGQWTSVTLLRLRVYCKCKYSQSSLHNEPCSKASGTRPIKAELFKSISSNCFGSGSIVNVSVLSRVSTMSLAVKPVALGAIK